VDRIKQLQNQLAANQALLVTDPLNIRYLSGFTGTSAYLLISRTAVQLITDYRYVQQATDECQTAVGGRNHNALVVICRDRARESLGACIGRLLASGCTELALEFHHQTVQAYQALQQELPALTLHDWPAPIEQRRAIKDAEELQLIRQAVAIAEQALAQTLSQIRLGMTEAEAATLLEQQLFAHGAQGLSFPTILLSGERSALPHGKPGARRLQHGDFLLIDFGAVVQGYRSDITRTYILGAATPEQTAFYQTVYQAQQAALAALRPGIRAEVLNEAAADVLQRSPYAPYAGEGIGHGIGLFLHEYPLMRLGCQVRLESGMVVTVEPGLYKPGFGGVRIEDDVLITADGIEVLSQAPKTLTILCATSAGGGDASY